MNNRTNLDNAKQISITVDMVSGQKTNKKGKPFISVKSGDNWWYIDDKALFPLFKKEAKLNVLVTTDNDFKKIVDVISDELGVVPKKSASTPIPSATPSAAKEINEKLDLILTKITDLIDIITEDQKAEEKTPF